MVFAMSRHKHITVGLLHIKQIRLQGCVNNSKMEHTNGEYSGREKVERGMKKKKDYLDGWLSNVS
jgi:hypothetical protein